MVGDPSKLPENHSYRVTGDMLEAVEESGDFKEADIIEERWKAGGSAAETSQSADTGTPSTNA
jgi:hypothetical protein